LAKSDGEPADGIELRGHRIREHGNRRDFVVIQPGEGSETERNEFCAIVFFLVLGNRRIRGIRAQAWLSILRYPSVFPSLFTARTPREPGSDRWMPPGPPGR
jgi:hypothetical protein